MEVESLKRITLKSSGEILVTVKWLGFDETTEEPLQNVVNGAHLALLKHLEINKKKYSKELFDIVKTAVQQSVLELVTNTYMRGFSRHEHWELLDLEIV